MPSPVYVPVAVKGIGGGVSALAGGQLHSCAVVSGAAKCWGSDTFGELGDGLSNAPPYSVRDVSGLGSGVSDIAAGHFHTCAVVNGGARCWGENNFGQLGDGGSAFQQDAPVAVPGLSSGVVQVAAGGYHSCALTSAGAVFCWGDNGFGDLGDGTTTRRYSPVAVSGLSSGVVEIAAGEYHTCARLSNGGVMCWGYNGYGQLGNGTLSDSPIPVSVVGLAAQCVVPNLKGKTLAAAKQALAKGKCRLGTVASAFSARVGKGLVISQKPRAGGRLASGAKVSVVLSNGRRR